MSLRCAVRVAEVSKQSRQSRARAPRTDRRLKARAAARSAQLRRTVWFGGVKRPEVRAGTGLRGRSEGTDQQPVDDLVRTQSRCGAVCWLMRSRRHLDVAGLGVKGQRSRRRPAKYRPERAEPLSEPSDSRRLGETRPVSFSRKMAGSTGLEPATSGVTGNPNNRSHIPRITATICPNLTRSAAVRRLSDRLSIAVISWRVCASGNDRTGGRAERAGTG